MSANEAVVPLGLDVQDAEESAADSTAPSPYKLACISGFGYLGGDAIISLRDLEMPDVWGACDLAGEEAALSSGRFCVVTPAQQRQTESFIIHGAEGWEFSTIKFLGSMDVAIVPTMQRWRTFLSQALRDMQVPRSWAAEGVAAETERTFQQLADTWRAETALTSSFTDLVLHPAYQRIIGMGRDALPLILRDLQREPDHWFWALRAITREDPVAPEDAGDIEKMAEAWLHLARARSWL